MKLANSFSALIALLLAVAFSLCACSASGGEQTFEPTIPDERGGDTNSSSGTSATSSSSSADEKWDSLFTWVSVPASVITRGTAKYGISAFEVASTEVTRKAYRLVMGEIPQQGNEGDSLPVEYVNWFQAALFCNAYSKLLGADTAYVYTSVGSDYYLNGLFIDYSAADAIRMLTENEWEVAARAGTTTTYYWNTDEAKKYAYYAQSKGPVAVASYIPNDFGLYDMAGNVAEWVNDWYGTYENKSVDNPTGAASGSSRVVRGGGWSSVAKDIAPTARDKKEPLYKDHTLGFRVGRGALLWPENL